MGRKFVTYGDLEVEYFSDADLPAAKAKLQQMILSRHYSAQVNEAAKAQAASQTPMQNAWGGFTGELGGLYSGARAGLKDIPVMGAAAELLPPLSQPTEAQIDINRQLPQYSPAALAGQTAGMVVGTAGAGRLAQLPGKVLPPVHQPVAVNAMTGALYEAAAQPSNATGEERVMAAALGAGLGGGPAALGRSLGAMVRPTPTPEAQALMAQGVPLTWGEQAGPGFRAHLETVLGALPFTGPTVRAARQASGEGFDRAMMRKVSPDPEAITRGGVEGYRQLRDAFKAGYDQIEARAPAMVDPRPAIAHMRAALSAAAPRMSPDHVAKANQYIDDFEAHYQGGVPYGMLKEEKSAFNTEATRAKNAGDRALGRVFDGFRKDVDNLRQNALSPEDWAQTQRLDQKYTQAQPVFAGHRLSVRTQAGYMTPAQLASGIYAKTPKHKKETDYARGERPLQEETKAAQEQVYSQPIPRIGPGTAEKLIGTGLGLGTIAGAGGLAAGVSPQVALLAPLAAGLDYGLSKAYPRLMRPYEPGWLSTYAPGLGAAPGLQAWDYLSGGTYRTGGSF